MIQTQRGDSRWRDLYRIGFVACLALPVVLILAVLAFFIWPYAPGSTHVADIFALLQKDRVAGLMSLDLSVPILLPIITLQMLALYATLKGVNESFALIALVSGLMGIMLWLTARPLVEMAYLSDQYATATSDAARSQSLAAGVALNALFNGTSWMLSQFFISISYTISSLLMFQSQLFSKATAWVGIVLGISGLGFFIPGIGVVVSLLGTLGAVPWYLLLARDFFKIGWELQPASLARSESGR